MLPAFSVALIGTLALPMTAFAASPATQPAPGIPGEPPIILLKLDDLGAWVSPRWERVTTFLDERKIHANYGLIGESLLKNSVPTIAWMKGLHSSGRIEIWCHGWHLRTATEKAGEWETGTADDQTAVLQRCEQQAQEKLGFPLEAFGTHWSRTTDATDEALSRIPEMKVWLAERDFAPKYFTGLFLPRVMSLEDPTFIPDTEKFKKHYDAKGHLQSVLVLQGHPDMWTKDAQWDGFVKIIDFLQSQHCRFMTIAEYQQHLNGDSTSATEPATK